MAETRIKDINISIWNNRKVQFSAHQDVNIIMGINGSGKTTFLSNLYNSLTENKKDTEDVVYLPSIDNISMRDKRKTATALSQDLEYYIYDMKTGPSLMSLRMSMIDSPENKQVELRARIADFQNAVNSLFALTHKRIEIEGSKFSVVTDNGTLPVGALSSGEMQILLILLRVFLLNGRGAVVLIDEPENSLDIDWQLDLVNLLVRLNPNAQFFITTHSPALFGDGWGDKVWYMEQITKM
ncbi:AAA family ATPase [Prevotella pectinovora]|uniref:AAA family ATPase n=1 Tax=Prevotella pectinovora TaxID=1602169 RepID=UPI00307D75BB